MFHLQPVNNGVRTSRFPKTTSALRFLSAVTRVLLVSALTSFFAIAAMAQTSIVTQHYDTARTGQNTNETILTPANVNTATFGKLFSYPVDGWVYAQPLYLPGVTMGAGTPQAGTSHNVLFIATEHDSVYAFDADSNTGANANPLWHITLLDNAHGVPAGITATTVPNGDVSTGDIVPEIGITSTGVIDPATNTLYIVGKTKETANPNGPYIQRLHALDVTTGAEKFGGPKVLSGSVPGNGSGSSAGTLNWDPKWQNNRASLLLLNGIVYIGFGSHGDNGPWHGWILAYNASSLAQTGAWCSTPNGSAAGIWMGGTGLAADVPDPAGHPFGRMFTATGNGSYDAVAPGYTNAMEYGDSIIKLDLTNGAPTMVSGTTTVGDDFTPHDQANLNNGDTDQASGGVVLLPDSVSGGQHLLAQLGKTGRIYVLNQDSLGGYNSNNTKDPEEKAYVGGLWGAPAYWNGNLYVWGTGDSLRAFSITNGVLSSTSTSNSVETAGTYSPTPSVSANGATNGIVWSLKTDNYGSQGREILYAHDATNVSKLLYSSESNVSRDNPGNSVKFIVPVVMNGKVYVGSESQVSVFGLLNGATQAATPVITPASQSFNPSLQVSISDSTTGATIYYTTDGSQPSTASAVYTAPFSVTSTTTVNAIAGGASLLQSPTASATYSLVTQVATPTFNPAPGSYTTVQSVTISTTTPNATIFYTLDGTPPATSAGGSTLQYTGPVSIGATQTLKAVAKAASLSNSPVAVGLYTIDLGGVGSINLSSGFTSTSVALIGASKINGTALRLTDAGGNETAAAWYNVPANIQNFTTDFSFLISGGSSPTADGFTFTIQANNASAIGFAGGGLGFGSDTTTGPIGIPNSIAVKFDLYSNAGEGVDSTGLYINGASPTTPFVDMTGSGIDLHSGHQFNVHIVYDGTNLTMTITDATTAGTFTHAWPINIPATVGGNTAYVGFTGGTGGLTAIQDILTWTLVSNGAQPTLTSIAVTPANSTAAAGTTVQFHATGTYSDNSTKDLTSTATWSSSNTAAISINSAGLATAGTAGQSASVTATSGTVSGSTTFTASAAVLKSIAVTPANSAAAAGVTVQFHATGTYSDNSSRDITAAVTWASSNANAVTITTTGLATAVTSGQAATISATSGAIAGSTTFTVSAATLKSIAVTPANPSIAAGATIQFHATGTYSDNSSKDITTAVTWTSSNTAAATINTAGLATAATAGQTSTISAASGAVSGATPLTVTAATSTINFGSGFTTTGLAMNGKAALNGTRLRLTDGGANEAASAWFTTPLNVQTFTTDFTFQLATPNADGITFTIQNAAVTALGPSGGGLGFGPDNVTNPSASTNTPIAKSVAVKFDLYSNAGEGTNSTGLYLNGASPTTPATTLGGGVNLHSGDIFKVHMVYDGTTLTMTITDTVNTAQTFTNSWAVNIPGTVGANTAFVGFTGGTGGATATQDIVTWTYTTTYTPPKTPVIYKTASLTAVSSGPTFRQFTFPGFPDTTGTILDATKAGDNVTFTVNVATAGIYDLKVSCKALNTRGTMQLAVNGGNVGPVSDQYSSNAAGVFVTFDLGNYNFAAPGNYSFKFTVAGKNAASSGFSISFDDFTLTPQ